MSARPIASGKGCEETLDKAMNVAIGVVERYGRYAQYVWLAPVTKNSLFHQPIADGASGFMYPNGEVRSAMRRLARGDGEVSSAMSIEQKLQVAS